MNLEQIKENIGKKILMYHDWEELEYDEKLVEGIILGISNIKHETCLVYVGEDLNELKINPEVDYIEGLWKTHFSNILPLDYPKIVPDNEIYLLSLNELNRQQFIALNRNPNKTMLEYIKKLEKVIDIKYNDYSNGKIVMQGYTDNRYIDLFTEEYIYYLDKKGTINGETYDMVKRFYIWKHELVKIIKVSPEGMAIIQNARGVFPHIVNIRNVKLMEFPVFEWEIITNS